MSDNSLNESIAYCIKAGKLECLKVILDICKSEKFLKKALDEVFNAPIGKKSEIFKELLDRGANVDEDFKIYVKEMLNRAKLKGMNELCEDYNKMLDVIDNQDNIKFFLKMERKVMARHM